MFAYKNADEYKISSPKSSEKKMFNNNNNKKKLYTRAEYIQSKCSQCERCKKKMKLKARNMLFYSIYRINALPHKTIRFYFYCSSWKKRYT